MTKRDRIDVSNYAAVQLALAILREVDQTFLSPMERQMLGGALGHTLDLGDAIEKRLEERIK